MDRSPTGSTGNSVQDRSGSASPEWYSEEAEAAPASLGQVSSKFDGSTRSLEPNPWHTKDDERRPLLSHPSRYDGSDTQVASSAASVQASSFVSTADLGNWSARKEEMRVIVRMTIPVYITQFLEYSFTVASVIAIGHLSTLELAASSLGTITATVTGYSVVFGMVSALDALLPQAWGSLDDEKQLVGLWTQRMVVVVAAILLPIFVLWQKAEAILILLRQEPEVARLAGLYLKWLSLGLPAYAMEYILRKYYQAQGLLQVPTAIIMAFAPINALLNYVLVWGPHPFEALELGFIGAPIATSISYNLIFFTALVYAVFWAPREAWHPLTTTGSWRKVFSGEALLSLLKLGSAGVGQTCSEWWSWELVGLAASLLGPVSLATQFVLLVSNSVAYQSSFALSSASSIRMGNLIGAGRAQQAQLAANTSLLLTLAVSGFNSAIFFIFRNSWGHLFNDDEGVVKLTAHILPLVALFQVLDGLGTTTGGILRATGRQYAGAILNLTGYYIIGIPAGLVLTFGFPQLELGLYGLWIGLSLALVWVASAGILLCARTDWEGEVMKAHLRLKSGERQGTEELEHGRID